MSAEIKNCLTCKWEPDWYRLSGITACRKELVGVPDGVSIDTYELDIDPKGRVCFEDAGGHLQYITDCPAYQPRPKDARGKQ